MVEGFQRLSHLVWRAQLRSVAGVMKTLIRVGFACHLPPSLVLPKSVKLGHNGLGVIINARSEIGEGCFIGSHVVLGGQPDRDGAPRLEANVVVHTGARVLGPITVGEGSVVAAGAVVTKSVPRRSLVAGIPARVLRSEIDHCDFRPNAWKRHD